MPELEQLIQRLEASAKDGKLSYARILRSGVAFAVLRARGWVDIPNAAGMWKPDKPPSESPNQEAD